MPTIQQQLIALKKEQILTAAIAVIGERGFQKTTIKQIAKQAGVADGTIYNYFENKDALLVAIVDQLSRQEVNEIQEAQASAMDYETFINTYIRARMGEIDEMYQMLKVILPETINNSELGAMIHAQIYEPGYQVAAQYIERLQKSGEVKLTAVSPIAARLFASPLLGLLLMRLLGDQHVTDNWQLYTEEIVTFLKNLGNPTTEEHQEIGD